MATMIQRAQAHCDAALNRQATLAEMNRLAQALYERPPVSNEQGFPIPYAELTNAQKAEVIVRATRHFYISAIQHAEAEVAANAAGQAARSQVETDLQESP